MEVLAGLGLVGAFSGCMALWSHGGGARCWQRLKNQDMKAGKRFVNNLEMPRWAGSGRPWALSRGDVIFPHPHATVTVSGIRTSGVCVSGYPLNSAMPRWIWGTYR